MFPWSPQRNPIIRFLRSLGPCANAGLIVGISAGGMLTALAVGYGGPITPTTFEIAAIVAMLTGFTSVLLLFLRVALMGMTLRSVALQSLMFCGVVCALTVAALAASGSYELGLAVGPVVGLAFGYLFCRTLRRWIG